MTDSAKYRGTSAFDDTPPLVANHISDHRAPSSMRARFKKIWLGPNGLRAGWSVLLFFAIAIGLLVASAVIARHLSHHATPPDVMTPVSTIVMELIMVSAVVIATKIMSLFDRKSWLDYGLRAPHRARHLVLGAFTGTALMTATMGVLLLTHGVTIAVASIEALALIKSGLLWAVAFVLVALFEELLCRGYAFFTLASGSHAMVAAVLLSLLFGFAHQQNGGERLTGLVAAGLFGMVLCLSVWRTGSLWWALGFHSAWDWSESFVFGASDSGQVAAGSWMVSHATGPTWLSGGSVGPEGSLLIFPALVVLTLVVLLTLPRNTQRWVRRFPSTTSSDMLKA